MLFLLYSQAKFPYSTEEEEEGNEIDNEAKKKLATA